MLSNDPHILSFFQRHETQESLKILDKLNIESVNHLAEENNECGYVDTEKYFDQQTNLIFRAKTNSLVRKIHKVKKKLLKDVKKYPEEYEKVKEMNKKQQKLKDEYPLIFIDKDVDLKKINIFKKTAGSNIFSSTSDAFAFKNTRLSNFDVQPAKHESTPSLAFGWNNAQESTITRTKQTDFHALTPFQRIETRNSVQRNFIKEKISKLQNRKFDFNINTNFIMKNINLSDNANNIEKQIISSVKEKAESLEKTKQNTEKDESLSIYPIRPQGVSLKRYFSSKEKVFKKASEGAKQIKENFLNVKRIESCNVIVIQDLSNSDRNNLSGQKLGKRLAAGESVGKTATDFFPLKIRQRVDLRASAAAEENKSNNNDNQNNLNNKILKNQCTENTEYYFYNKHEDNNNNNKNKSELRNYFEYKKRPQTNHLKASPKFYNGNRRIISSKLFSSPPEKSVFCKERAASQLKKDKDIAKESKPVVIVNRKHASVQYKDLSKEIQVVKVDRMLLEKIKNF